MREMEGPKNIVMENGHLSDSRQRIGVVGISPSVERPEAMPFHQLYNAVGKNTGNLMFTQAMFRQLAGKVTRIGFSFNTDQINQKFDSIVIPAANWLNSHTDWTWFIKLIERIEIPVITIGIGLQAQTLDKSAVMVHPTSIELAKTLSQKAASISTRGNFTRDWLHSIGIDNVVSTGCPSLYMKVVDSIDKQSGRGIVLQSTRHKLTEKFLNDTGINRQIYRLAGRLNMDIIYQSEMEEIEYNVYGNSQTYCNEENLKRLIPLYGFSNFSDLISYLDEHGKIFFDINQWSAFLKTHSGLVGTRLHGTILALNAGVAAILIPHDSRTAELIDFAKLPSGSLPSDISLISEKMLIEKLEASNMELYLQTQQQNLKTYLNFLSSNHLQANLNGFIL
jgi:polysaccharide pyruvyl transferase WcaK-like protein